MEEIVEKKVRKTASKKTTTKAQEFLGTGRRKCSVARVRISVGTGKITINEQDINEYFELETLKTIVKQPLVLTETLNNVDVVVNIYGGGKTGQAGAIRHGRPQRDLQGSRRGLGQEQSPPVDGFALPGNGKGRRKRLPIRIGPEGGRRRV